MIAEPPSLDQYTLTCLREADPVVQHYRAFFALLNWNEIDQQDATRHQRGPRPHPKSAYLKAFLVGLCEGKPYRTQLRTFLLQHPWLVLELGFRPHTSTEEAAHAPYGFDVGRTVPSDRWLRAQLQHLDETLLQSLFMQSVHALQQEIPGLGETVAFDVKHIFAWVRENNPNVYVKGRFDVTHIPTGDPDCRLGVKKSTNQEQPDGSKKEKKVSLFGYGTGVAACTDPVYGDVVVADFTQPFNEGDVTYFRPLYPPTSPLMPPSMPGTCTRALPCMAASEPFRSISMPIPRFPAMPMARPGVPKACSCILPFRSSTPMGTAPNASAARCSFLT